MRGDARMSWVLAFVGFALLIVLHELGHFAAAKARRHARRALLAVLPADDRQGPHAARPSTAIGAIPLGGYVKITGMNPHEELPPEVAPPRLLRASRSWKRIVVIAAGPGVNLVIAFVIFWAAVRSANGGRATDRRSTPVAAELPGGDASCSPATASSRSTA